MNGWKQQIRKYGIAGSKTIAKAAGDLVRPEDKDRDESLAYRRKEQADICLNCKNEECTGTEECFKKHAKKEQNETVETKSQGSD